MNERELAQKLSWDIDRLMREVEGSEVEPTTESYERTLELVRELISLDLSHESRKRDLLSRRLETGLVDQTEERGHHGMVAPVTLWSRRPIWTISLGATCALLLIALSVPDARTAASEIIKYVQELVLGEHLQAIQLSQEYAEARMKEYRKTQAHPPFPARDDLLKGPQVIFDEYGWMLISLGGNGSGYVPAGAEPKLHRFQTIHEVVDALPFLPLVPGYVPEGHELREALVTPDNQVFLFYGEPAREIIVSQSRVDSHATMSVMTNGDIERATVQGVGAVWMNGNPGGALCWESNGYVFSVQTADQPESEAIRIADSLQQPSGAD
ncbi:MAG: DUF4367 domain-containing protein [Acidobacteriota bacterium]